MHKWKLSSGFLAANNRFYYAQIKDWWFFFIFADSNQTLARVSSSKSYLCRVIVLESGVNTKEDRQQFRYYKRLWKHFLGKTKSLKISELNWHEQLKLMITAKFQKLTSL
jgi:hypothetical protein